MKPSPHDLAAAHADQHVSELQEYLRGDEKTQRRIAEKWLDEELAKPRTCAQMTGIGDVP